MGFLMSQEGKGERSSIYFGSTSILDERGQGKKGKEKKKKGNERKNPETTFIKRDKHPRPIYP